MRIGLVGFGKVGQAIYTALQKNAGQHRGLQLVAVVDQRFGGGLTPPLGVHVLAEHRRTHLPWRFANLDLVIDASGSITTRQEASEHLSSGAPRVLVTSTLADAQATLIKGVNESTFDPFKHLVIAASSCTAVSFAPVAKIIAEKYGISRMHVVVQHGYDTAKVKSDVDLNRITPPAYASLLAGQAAPYQTNFVRNVTALLPNLVGALSAEGWYVPHNRTLLFKVEMELMKTTSNLEINALVGEAADNNQGMIGFPTTRLAANLLFPGNHFPTVFLPWETHVVGHRATLYFGGDYIYGYANAVLSLARHLTGETA